MVQQILVILIVAGCAAWVGWMGWRFFAPKKGAGCGGGCGCGHEMGEGNAKLETRNAKLGEQMVRSDDLRARVSARKTTT